MTEALALLTRGGTALLAAAGDEPDPWADLYMGPAGKPTDSGWQVLAASPGNTNELMRREECVPSRPVARTAWKASQDNAEFRTPICHPGRNGCCSTFGTLTAGTTPCRH